MDTKIFSAVFCLCFIHYGLSLECWICNDNCTELKIEPCAGVCLTVDFSKEGNVSHITRKCTDNVREPCEDDISDMRRIYGYSYLVRCTPCTYDKCNAPEHLPNSPSVVQNNRITSTSTSTSTSTEPPTSTSVKASISVVTNAPALNLHPNSMYNKTNEYEMSKMIGHNLHSGNLDGVNYTMFNVTEEDRNSTDTSNSVVVVSSFVNFVLVLFVCVLN